MHIGVSMNKFLFSVLLILSSIPAFSQETELRPTIDSYNKFSISEAAKHVDIVLEIEELNCRRLYMYVAQREVVSTSMAEKRTIFFEAFSSDFANERTCSPDDLQFVRVRSKIIRLNGVDNGYGTSVVMLDLIVPANVKVIKL